jgi:DNA repair exonuclease SbcCD ATPase subunit
MKVLCFSDVHLDYPADPTDGTLELFAGTSGWLVEQIKKFKPELVVNLGDTNHRDGGMSTGTVKLAFEFFDPIIRAIDSYGGSLVNIVGNHDQHTRDGSLHVMEMLKWSSTVVDEPEFLRFGKSNTPFLFLPYQRDPEAFVASMRQLLEEHGTPAAGFMHMDVVGAQMNSGSKTSHGLDAGIVDFPMFNGHYHLPQQIGGVEVIGAPQYTQFRDTDPLTVPRRGAVLLTLQKNGKWKKQRVTNPHTKLYAKFKGTSAEDLKRQYDEWYTAVAGIYGTEMFDLSKPETQRRELLNIWFVGPKVELTKLESNNDWSGFGTVRLTSNDKVTVEETTITLDLNPETAVAKWFEEASCSCGATHHLDNGVAAIRQAVDYSTADSRKRQIRFNSMKLQNFMQFVEANVEFNDKGLVLIEGINADDVSVDSNASGKSTISEALLWTLFDRTSRGLGKDEIIRWGEKKAQVQVSLEVDGRQMTITRTRTKGRGVLNILDEEGKDITPHDQSSATEMVASLLGVTFDQFLLLVVMAQGFDAKFSSLNDADRKETLEAFLGLEVYDAARDLVAEQIKGVDAQLSKFDQTVMQANATKATAENQLRLAEAEKARVEQEQKSELSLIEKQIAEYDAVLPGWKVYLADADKALAEATDARKSAEKALNDSKFQLQSRNSELQALSASVKRQHDRHTQITAEVSALQSTGAACPTCRQQLPGDRIQLLITNLLSEQETLTQSIESSGTKWADIQDSMKSIGEQTLSIETYLPTLQQRVSEASATAQTAREQVTRMKAELDALHREHQKSSRTVDRFDVIIGEARRVISGAVDQQKEAEANKLSFTAHRHELKFWQDAFEPTGIRSHLLRTVVNYLNEYLYELSEKMTGGTFNVQLSSTKELKSSKETRNKIDVTISPSGEPYKACSGGMRRKVDLMLNLAIAKLARQTSGFSTNILVADEVLDNLDFTASQFAIRVFEQMAAEGISVFLISHNHLVKSMIPNAWTVVRKGGVSELRVG